MITILQGSNGSGKSFVAYQLLAEFPNTPVLWPPQTPPNHNKRGHKIVGYIFPGDLFLAGPYTARACGGLDSISGGFPKVQQPFLERACRKFRHVFAESMMASLNKREQWYDLDARLKADGVPSLPIIFPTLNTPQEVCIQQIYQRNGGKPVNEDAINSNWRRVQRQRVRLEKAGYYCPYVDRDNSYEHVKALLKWGGWNP